MKEKISMQLQIPLALIIVTLLPIVSAQALSDDATTTIGRQIQSEVEINLEILNSLPSNDLSLGTVKIGKSKKSFTPAQEAKDTGSKINKTTSTNSIGAITPPTKPIISFSPTPNFVPPKKNTPISVPKKPNVELKKTNKEKVSRPKKRISVASKSRSKVKKIKSASKKEIQSMINLCLSNLEDINFFKPKEKKPVMLQNLRNIFYKMELSDKETRILSSVFASLGKKR